MLPGGRHSDFSTTEQAFVQSVFQNMLCILAAPPFLLLVPLFLFNKDHICHSLKCGTIAI